MKILTATATYFGAIVLACLALFVSVVLMNKGAAFMCWLLERWRARKHCHSWKTAGTLYHEGTPKTVYGTLLTGHIKLVCSDTQCHAAKLMRCGLRVTGENVCELYLFDNKGRLEAVCPAVGITIKD